MQISADQPSQQAAAPVPGPAPVAAETVWTPAPAPAPAPAAGRSLPPKNLMIIILAVAIVAVVAAVYMLGRPAGGQGSTSAFTTTIASTGSGNSVVYGLTGCSNITSPGTYTVNSRIKTAISRGACINIAASNVRLSCGANRIIGSGPYDALPPFAYGIRISRASNVTVSDCYISNFSYGVGVFSSRGVTVSGSNVSSNYMSNIYFNSTLNSTIENNMLTRSLSWQGSVFLSNRSSSNLVYNNTIAYNQVYGINVSSGGETFLGNRVNITSQYGFYCSPSSSYPVSSSARGNVCYDNYGCGFLACSGKNVPANISKVVLAGGVSGCGSINHPGNYLLEEDINMGDYLNISNPAASSQSLPCIAIRASNVRLNCGGHGIYNGTYPIAVYGALGDLIENCRIRNASGYGIALISSPNSTVANTTVTGAALGGLLIQGSNSDNVTNSSFSGGGYGIVINDSQSNNLLDVNASRNGYGVYVEGSSSVGNNFYQVRAFNNSRIDIYADSGVSGAQVEFTSGMNCHNTNAHWAPCTLFVVSNLGYTLVPSCMAISSPGSYVLQGQLLEAQDDCITISSSNVAFSCGGSSIDTNQASSQGFGVAVQNASNVTVRNCTLEGFMEGVYAHNSRGVSIENVGVWNSGTGILLNGTAGSRVIGDSINGSTSYGIRLVNTSTTNVSNNNLQYGPGSAVGIALNGSRLNTVLDNLVTQYHYGFTFSGQSGNNLISNNTASLSSAADYVCNGNSNLSAEQGGMNYGVVKIGCRWMALIQRINANPPCTATSGADTFSLASDYVYPYGSVCFSMLNNGTTINCNGHTVLATNGGTFAQLAAGTRGGVVENCYLKGFDTAIEAYGSGNIYNNTMLQTSASASGVVAGGFPNGMIAQNNVTGGSVAFAAYNTLNLNMQNNFVYLSRTAYYLYNAVGMQMSGDYAAPSTAYGLAMNGSGTSGTLRGLTLNSNAAGLSCTGGSQNDSLISDLGGVSCVLQQGCNWLHSSSGSC